MAAKNKRDALEALICERIEREIGRLEGQTAGTTSVESTRMANQRRIDGLKKAKDLVQAAFEECK